MVCDTEKGSESMKNCSFIPRLILFTNMIGLFEKKQEEP